MLRTFVRANDLRVLTMRASNNGLRVLGGFIHSLILNWEYDTTMSVKIATQSVVLGLQNA